LSLLLPVVAGLVKDGVIQREGDLKTFFFRNLVALAMIDFFLDIVLEGMELSGGDDVSDAVDGFFRLGPLGKDWTGCGG